MNAFLTGSMVYGTPHEASDIDMCVLMDEGESSTLEGLGEYTPASGEFCDGWRSIRFGHLNIIATCDAGRFEVWRQATNDLAARKPVTKAEAVEHWELLEGAYDAIREVPIRA